MRDEYRPRGERGYGPSRRSFLRRLVTGVIFIAILIAGGSAVYYLYMRGTGKDPVVELSDGLGVLADRFKGGKGEAAGEKLRDLGRYLEEHGDEIDKYGGEVERRLEDIKGVSEDAYLAAKRKIDEFREKKAEGRLEDEPSESPADGPAGEPPAE